MASVLFIAPEDLGEAVLATGALAYALREGGEATILCSAAAAPLFRAVPGLASLIVASGATGWAKLAGRRFDVLVDASGVLLSKTIAAQRRYALKPAPIVRRRAEDWAAAMGAEQSLAPVLWIDAQARGEAAAAAPEAQQLLVLAPGGVSAGKRWPADRFAAVARRLCDGPLNGADVVVFGAAARDADATRAIVSSLDADGIAACDLCQRLDLLACAALLERATLTIGNDNALTHIAAAVGAPTLTLFGPTDERVRAPHGPRARTLRGRSFEAAALDAGGAMADISIDAVEAAALDLLRAGGLR